MKVFKTMLISLFIIFLLFFSLGMYVIYCEEKNGHTGYFKDEQYDCSHFDYIEIDFKNKHNNIDRFYLTNVDKRFSIIQLSSRGTAQTVSNRIIVQKLDYIYLNDKYTLSYRDNDIYLNDDILFYSTKEYPNTEHNLVLFNDELWYGSYIDKQDHVTKQANITY